MSKVDASEADSMLKIKNSPVQTPRTFRVGGSSKDRKLGPVHSGGLSVASKLEFQQTLNSALKFPTQVLDDRLLTVFLLLRLYYEVAVLEFGGR